MYTLGEVYASAMVAHFYGIQFSTKPYKFLVTDYSKTYSNLTSSLFRCFSAIKVNNR